MERAIETQRLRLLRLVAGLLVAVGFLSVGPVSRVFSEWACGFVGSVLSRAELASRYLVIVQARRIMAERDIALDFSLHLKRLPLAFDTPEAVSRADCRSRLMALQAVLRDLPRHALRLLRRIKKQSHEACADRARPRPDAPLSTSLHNWHLAESFIERPPDKIERQFDQASTHRYLFPLSPVSGRET